MNIDTNEEKQFKREQRTKLALQEIIESLHQIEQDLEFHSDYILLKQLSVCSHKVSDVILELKTIEDNLRS